MKLEAHHYLQHQLACFLGDVKHQYVKRYISKEEYDQIVEVCKGLSAKMRGSSERCKHRWTGIRRFENGQQVLICELCGDHQTGWVWDKKNHYSDTEAVFGIPFTMLKDDEKKVLK
jgi:hypothetical protein